IGQYLYSGNDYAEYYSQFPAHNTVCVDGISSYPVMMSNHAFEMVDSGRQPSGRGRRPTAWCRLSSRRARPGNSAPTPLSRLRPRAAIMSISSAAAR
ncbi:MAG: heparinase II/III family protein, partial [Prevotella sp.]|nr:heparinase II/III family protein [Prevotella sp.]